MLSFLKNAMPEDLLVNDRSSFIPTTETNLHSKRRKAILSKYPEVRKFMKPYPLTSVYIILSVGAQIILGYLLREQSIWLVLGAAFLVGAIISHGLFVLLHDASHHLIFKRRLPNKLFAILTNVGQGFPSAMSFQKFHFMHHAHLNHPVKDADPPLPSEAKIFSASAFGKFIWLFFLGLIQSLRPGIKGAVNMIDGWFVFNLVAIIGIDAWLFYLFGWKFSLYVFGSTFFGLGLHPIGARWLQEHYVFKKGQETYSYYGVGNLISFNIGYHNEHHDIMNIPWVHLPKLKKIAPEFYEPLFFHRSWTKLYFYFIFNPHYTLFNRHNVISNEDKEVLTRKGEFIDELPLIASSQK